MRVNKKITADLANFIKMRYNISVTDYAEKYPEMFKSFMRMQYWLDEATLARYFGPNDNAEEEGTYWVQQLKWDTRRTGKELLAKLTKSNPAKIIDVGCGDNEWKQYFGDKLIGIDPFNENADFIIGVNEYAPEHLNKYDVALALGSINFGDQTEIERQIGNVVHMVKPGGKIYWRMNPGITHDNPQAQWVDFFPWSEEYIKDIASRCNCIVNEISWDHTEVDVDVRWGNRLYSEWTLDDKYNTV
jgi:hypothetical protein